MPIFAKNKYRKLPECPGVYLFHDAYGKILYVGKAVNLRRRVGSYFSRPLETRLARMVEQAKKIEYRPVGSAIEALVLEAKLIKQFQPPVNIREKDDKSFLYVGLTKENFPAVLLLRGKELESHPPYELSGSYGPFTSSSAIREALRILRGIFPYSIHAGLESRKSKTGKPCFDYQIGLCPGTCIGAIGKEDYMKIIRDLKDFLEGRTASIMKRYQNNMKKAADGLEFEKAADLRKKLFALKHIRDVAVIKEDDAAGKTGTGYRIEGYDISNISGASAVGSMVVFEDNEPAKQEYRKFKIRTVRGANDVAMLKEVITRRFGHKEWRTPDLILVDGGAPQLNSVKQTLHSLGVKVPVIGMAKGPERKRTDIYGIIPAATDKKILIRVRDESHRFAIGYHRKLRNAGAFD